MIVVRSGLLRPIRAGAAAAIVAAAFGCLATASAAEETQPIDGIWTGRYVCAQGPTGATLTIKTVPPWPGMQVYLHRLLMGWLANPETRPPQGELKRLEIEAQFRFYALPENSRVPSGTYELTGTYDPKLGVLNLYPSQWISRPEGYDWAGIKAVLEDDGSLAGALEIQGCGMVVLHRAEQGAALPDQNVEGSKPKAPSATLEFSEELMKLNRELFQLDQAGEHEKALATANQAVVIAERVYGPDHPTVAAELRFLALALMNAGRSPEAESVIRRALGIDEKALGRDNPTTAFDLQVLSGVLLQQSLKNNQPPAQGKRVLLTGQLPGILSKAVPLALVASLLLLWIYRRAVKRSMARRGGAGEAAAPNDAARQEAAPGAVPLQFVTADEGGRRDEAAAKLKARGFAGPWRNAAIYAVAGLGYVLTLTSASLYAAGLEFLPVRFAFIALANAWPIVLTIGLVAPVSWRGWIVTAGVYLLLFIAVSAIGVARSETFTWDQAARMWLLTNIPGTFLILAFLPRPIRAVGPLVLVFMVAAVTGADLWHNLFDIGGSESMLRAVRLFGSLGLNNMDAVAAASLAAQLIGVLILSLVGWLCLRGLGRLYAWRLVSDQSVLIDSLWFLFALTGAVDFAFFGGWWFLAPLGAFAIYKLIAFLGFALFKKRSAKTDPTLLLLRVFSLGKRSALLFDAFAKRWRHTGRIRLIAGPDLATSTVEPHEFLDFLSGKLGRRFISGPDTLAQRLAETEQRRDIDGRYRVDDFFCHDDTWQMVLKRLSRESDAVLMDLRGFLPENQGCVFEINELLNVVPLDRVVFVVDATTDLAFLRETFARGWAALEADSPNRKLAEPKVLLFEFSGESSVSGLMRVVSEAARGEAPDGAPRLPSAGEPLPAGAA